jgi:hypothetical protein
MNIKRCLTVFVLFLISSAVLASDLDRTDTGFVYPLGKRDFSSSNGWWLSKDTNYFPGEYHIGVDMMAEFNSIVYAVADGKAKKRSSSDWGDGNCAAVIEHKTSDGKVFTAIYGHLQCSSLIADNSDVYIGQPIGRIGDWPHGDHVHFGIHDGSYSTIAKSGWGRRLVDGNWTNPCVGSCLNTFISPVEFIENNYAYNPSTEVQAKCVANVCWKPTNVGCEQANEWYLLPDEPIASYATPVGSYACTDVKQKLTAIAQSPHHDEAVPENSRWQMWWRFLRNALGKVAQASDIVDAPLYGSILTINVQNNYAVVAGNGTKASHGTGMGYATLAIEAPVPTPPDYVTNKVWLTTPWQEEAYTYGRPEIMKTHAQFENKGDGNGNCSAPIEVHFYLSKGYKEDAHSGDGAWKRVGTDFIQCNHLEPGMTHSEEEGIELWRDIPEPGIYNITAYIDHIRDDHNDGGAYSEKHESNNGSTEAVFEVTADGQVVNVPNIDLIAHSLQFLQTPTYAGDQARLGGYIQNIGNNPSQSDIRSSYSVVCPGTGTVYLTDDGTESSNLIPGQNNWEETIASVTMPNATGNCTAYLCADYQNAVTSEGEDNNCSTLNFTLQPRPAPKLVITKFQDQKGCCTTNTGEYVYPDIWVRNDGQASPLSNVRVLYRIASNGTGGAWWTIGYGTISPSELPPGKTDEDYMDGDRWRIPKDGSWKKQWHTIQACVNPRGEEPTCTGDDSISTYGRYSKK